MSLLHDILCHFTFESTFWRNPYVFGKMLALKIASICTSSSNTSLLLTNIMFPNIRNSCIVAGYTTRMRIFCNKISNEGRRPELLIKLQNIRVRVVYPTTIYGTKLIISILPRQTLDLACAFS